MALSRRAMIGGAAALFAGLAGGCKDDSADGRMNLAMASDEVLVVAPQEIIDMGMYGMSLRAQVKVLNDIGISARLVASDKPYNPSSPTLDAFFRGENIGPFTLEDIKSSNVRGKIKEHVNTIRNQVPFNQS